jgi:hypothetical protein
MAVTMKNAAFLALFVEPMFQRNVSRQVTANAIPSARIPFTIMMEAIHSSKTSVLTDPHGVTSQYGILHNFRCATPNSYVALTGWTLQQRRNVSPVRYELPFYIPEGGIFQLLSVVRNHSTISSTSDWQSATTSTRLSPALPGHCLLKQQVMNNREAFHVYIPAA